METSHGDGSDDGSSLLWAAPVLDADPVTEEATFEGVFAFPQPHGSFKEYMGNKTDLGRAVIPAAVLAGYTGEQWFEGALEV